MNIENLTSTQLRQAADLKEKIAGLEKQLAELGGNGSGMPSPFKTGRPGKRKMSPAHKAKIRAAQKLRWAKHNAAKGQPAHNPAKKRGMSAAGRARIVAAQKLRWAKINAGKTKPAAPKPARRKMSAAGRAAISAAARARWAKAKAAGKTSL
jgi:hypothetical protein